MQFLSNAFKNNLRDQQVYFWKKNYLMHSKTILETNKFTSGNFSTVGIFLTSPFKEEVHYLFYHFCYFVFVDRFRKALLKKKWFFL